jgi:Secretion system C-terminal sorting domain
MKKNIYTLLFLLLCVSVQAAVGIWQVGVVVNGTSFNTVASTATHNLGTFPPMGVVLNAGSASSYQNSGDDVCAVNTRYSVNGSAPATLAPLSFVSQSGGDKNWAITGQTLNLSAVPNGAYTVEIFFDIIGKFGNIPCTSPDNSTLFPSNGAGKITLNFTIATPMPVALTRFQAEMRNTGVALAWNTASESDNSHFSVERSANMNSWTSVGKVAGAQFSETATNYSYLDSKPLSGKSYYRLAQVDVNGNIEYSPVVSVQQNKTVVSIYPNPVTDRVYVALEVGATMFILNSTGQQVMNQLLTESIWIDLSALPQGVYHIQCVDETGAAVLNEKLMKI